MALRWGILAPYRRERLCLTDMHLPAVLVVYGKREAFESLCPNGQKVWVLGVVWKNFIDYLHETPLLEGAVCSRTLEGLQITPCLPFSLRLPLVFALQPLRNQSLGLASLLLASKPICPGLDLVDRVTHLSGVGDAEAVVAATESFTAAQHHMHQIVIRVLSFHVTNSHVDRSGAEVVAAIEALQFELIIVLLIVSILSHDRIRSPGHLRG